MCCLHDGRSSLGNHRGAVLPYILPQMCNRPLRVCHGRRVVVSASMLQSEYDSQSDPELFACGATQRVPRERAGVQYMNKTYCYLYISTCLAFIPSQCIQDDVATCNICYSKTCSICKGKCHENEDCPSNQGVKELLSIAVEEKWQRCYSCRRMVELTTGCNHISKLWLFGSLKGSVQLIICQLVAAKPSSATTAACSGSNVAVLFGMKLD